MHRKFLYNSKMCVIVARHQVGLNLVQYDAIYKLFCGTLILNMVQNMWLQLCLTKVVRSLFTSSHDHTFPSFVTNGHLMIFYRQGW